MGNVLDAVTRVVIEGLLKLVAPLLFWLKGQSDNQATINEKDANVLQKQRDNNTTGISATRAKWVRIRKDNDQ